MKKYVMLFFSLVAIILIFTLWKNNSGKFGQSEEAEDSKSKIANRPYTNQNSHQDGSNLTKSEEGGLADGTWLPDQEFETLEAGGLALAVTFEEEIPKELRKVILHDLNLIYGHLQEHEILDGGGMPDLNVNGERRTPDHFVQFTGEGRYFPRELTGKIGLIVDGDLFITNDVIEIYQEAWSRMSGNEQKYHRLLEVISQLNSLNDELSLKPKDWFFLGNEARNARLEMPEISLEQFKENFGNFQYRRPSLLDVSKRPVFETNVEEALVSKIYVFDSDGVISNQMPPMIFTEGTWKFWINPPPT